MGFFSFDFTTLGFGITSVLNEYNIHSIICIKVCYTYILNPLPSNMVKFPTEKFLLCFNVYFSQR